MVGEYCAYHQVYFQHQREGHMAKVIIYCQLLAVDGTNVTDIYSNPIANEFIGFLFFPGKV